MFSTHRALLAIAQLLLATVRTANAMCITTARTVAGMIEVLEKILREKGAENNTTTNNSRKEIVPERIQRGIFGCLWINQYYSLRATIVHYGKTRRRDRAFAMIGMNRGTKAGVLAPEVQHGSQLYSQWVCITTWRSHFRTQNAARLRGQQGAPA